jgi:hypothetical protein
MGQRECRGFTPASRVPCVISSRDPFLAESVPNTAPNELKHVRDSIFTLLSVSPNDVFAVMLDDFRGSEEETGASRRNILEFLYKVAGEERKKLLESGDRLDVEKTFREGFGDLVASLPWNEAVKVLAMMVRLSTISGRNRTEETCGDFARILRKALRPGRGGKELEELLGLFDLFMKKNPPVDSRGVLVFFATHGEGVVELAFEADSAVARKIIVDHLDEWVEDSQKIWRSDTRGRDFKEKEVGPDFCVALLRGLRVS